MRELTTIGSLQSLRRADRGARMMTYRGMGWMGWIGQTNPNYVPPTDAELDAHPPGTELSNATVAMLEHFQTAGVPSEHDSDPFVLAFQQAYNRDPAPWAAATMKLGEDGGFGQNSHDAAAALVVYMGGGAVPAVNASAAPVAPTPNAPAPSTPGVTVLPQQTIVGHEPIATWKIALGVAAAAAAAYGVARMMKKKRRRGRRRSTAIVLA